MRLRDRIRLAVNVLRGGPAEAVSPYSYSSPAPRTTVTLLQAYNQNPMFRAVVGRMASGVSMQPWHLTAIRDRRGAFIRVPELQTATPKERWEALAAMPPDRVVTITQHPMLQMMRSGNPLIVGIMVMEMTQAYLEICGTAIWLLERKRVLNKRIPVKCWPLPPHWIAEVPSPSNPNYLICFPREVREIPAEDIIRFHIPDLSFPYQLSSGIGGTLANQMDVSSYLAQHVASTFMNNTVPPFIGVFEGASDDALKRLQARLIEESQGVKKRGKPFLVNRKTDIVELSQEFDKLQLVDLSKYNRDEFIQTYSVPPELLAVIESANRSTISGSNYIHSRWNLTPRLEFDRSTLQERLVPQYDDRLLLDYENPVDEDDEYVRQLLQQHPYGFSVNEIRAQAKKGPIPNGELHPIPGKWRFGPIDDQPPPGTDPGGPDWQPPGGGKDGEGP